MVGLLGEYFLVTIFVNVVVVSKLKGNLEKGLQEQNHHETFEIVSSLTSVWVPSIVCSKSDMYWTSAVSSLGTKLVMITSIIVIACTSDFFALLRNSNIFLLWCVEKADLNDNIRQCSEFDRADSNLTRCFSMENYDMLQKTRVCTQQEIEIRMIISLVLLVSALLSLLASFNLNQLTKWSKFAKPSWFFCYPVKPFYHRSLLFDFIHNNDAQGLDTFLDGIEDSMVKKSLVNVYDAYGRKAMLVAKDLQLMKIWAILAKHGGVHSDHGDADIIVNFLVLLEKMEQSNIAWVDENLV